jgi:hypothetical protein
MSESALSLLHGLICEDEVTTWGEQAARFQLDDAAAICADPSAGPRRHFLVRPRGASKTTDIAAIGLSLLVSSAPKRSRSYVYAVDESQALEVLDALSGFVSRTEGLSGAVELSAKSVTVRSTGASLTVESSDAASAWSKRPWLTILDEYTSWPETRGHQTLWKAVASSLPKRRDSRLVILAMAGSPRHPAAAVWKIAQASADWRASTTVGPCPWWTQADVDSTRLLLTPAEFSRYIECQWVEVDSALSSEADVSACVRSSPSVLPPRNGVSYVAALDIGVRRDLTALIVAHVENRSAGRTTIVDRVISWRPTTGMSGRVDLGEVERTTARLCKEYRAKLRFDRSQGEQLTQNLSRQGIRVEEFVFSQAGANRLAKALYTSLRDHSIEVPDDPETISELMSTRLVETTPGMLKLSNPVGSHDDIPVAISMALVDLQDRMTGLPGSLPGPEMSRRAVAGYEELGERMPVLLPRPRVMISSQESDAWRRFMGMKGRDE